MKDLVENRRRITFTKKLQIAGIVLRENGIFWSALLGVYYAASSVSQRAFAAMDALRKKKGIPGMNSRALNKAIWEAWDWGAGGEEWTPSEAWKASVIRCILEKHVPANSSVLEIGPGGGRWTGYLIERAAEFLAVDISEPCVELCRKKFGSSPKARFIVGSGNNLAGVADASVDALWSFDVFVHINREEVESYADEFLRVMRPGAVGVIHHGTLGGTLGGWRSNLIHEGMLELLKQRGFQIVTSFKEWQDGDTTHQAGLYQDAVTVFCRPAQ
jgi:ubiquinone/menaquinone biosynthesis C-methylase UbiE